MLLRSSSTPILNSWLPHSRDSSSPEPEIVHQIPRTRSIVSLSISSSSSSSSLVSPIDSGRRMTRTMSETDLRDTRAVPKRKPAGKILSRFEEIDEMETGLGFRCSATAVVEGRRENGVRDLVSVLVGGGGGGGGGRISGGGGGGGGDGGDGSSGFWDSNQGNRSTDLYYQKMIEANPGNPLLLSNYAKFLKNVHGDLVKAEEYCGRAILADPSDASVLSMYADLIWTTNKDASRAEVYYEQAVKAAPNDCFVLASYAHFLWDTEEEEGGDEEDETNLLASLPSYFHGVPPTLPPLTAAS